MTAPTPRETADFEALAVEASAARNLDGAKSMMVSIQTIYDLIVSRNALLSEIAALRGEVERRVSRPEGEYKWKRIAQQAERQRDEARSMLIRARDLAVIYPANAVAKAIRRDINAFLANQGAD